MIHLDLQPEVEAELAAQALSHGLPIERYLKNMVTDRLGQVRVGASRLAFVI